MIISVVIPTYNRVDQLSEVLDCLLNTETDGLFDVEIIVVDDGSELSPEAMLSGKRIEPPFSARFIRQENGGPARARNRGLAEASGELVLFIDDDVLVEPSLLRQHLEAHEQLPGSVVFGPYPYRTPEKETPSYRYMKGLVDVALVPMAKGEEFVPIETVASGNLSIERAMFLDEFYDDRVRTPAAEEFALIHRLISSGIPIYVGKKLLASHTQPTVIADKCKQEYKYGIGIAELAKRLPETLEVPALNHLYHSNCEIMAKDGVQLRLKKSVRALLARGPVRDSLLKLTSLVEATLPFDQVLFPLYRVVIGTFLFAGIRDGIKKFES